MHLRAAIVALVASTLATGAPGCGELAEPSQAPALATWSVDLSGAQGLPLEGPLRLSLVWFALDPDGSGRGQARSADELGLTPQDLVGSQAVATRLPPRAALLDASDPRHGVAALWPDGTRGALGRILAYEDRDGDGRFGLPAADSGTDRPVGVVASHVVMYVEGAAAAGVASETALGPGFHLVADCPEGGCPDGHAETVRVTFDQADAQGALQCGDEPPSSRDVVETGAWPSMAPPEGSCGADGVFVANEACAVETSACHGRVTRCTRRVLAVPTDMGLRRDWPCPIPDWCHPDSEANPCPWQLIATKEVEPSGVVADDAFWYWATADGSIRRAPRAGGAPQDLFVPSTRSEPAPGHRVLRRDGEWLVWLVLKSDTMHRVRLDGTGSMVVKVGDPQAGDLELEDGWIYWTVHAADGSRPSAVRGKPIVGGDGLAWSIEGLGKVRALASDATHLYWRDEANGWIQRVPYGGETPETLAQTDPLVSGVVSDVGAGYVYWYETIEAEVEFTEPSLAIHRVSLADGVDERWLTGLALPRTVQFVGDGVAWLDEHEGSVHWASLAGDGPVTLGFDAAGNGTLMADGTGIVWTRVDAGTVRRAELP